MSTRTYCPDCFQAPCACAGSTTLEPSAVSLTPAKIMPRGTKSSHTGAIQPAPLVYSRFTCDNEDEAIKVRKRVKLNEHGDLEKLSPEGFWRGSAQTVIGTVRTFLDELQHPKEKRSLLAFFTAGTNADATDKPLRMGSLPGGQKRSRSKEDFPFPEQNALLVIDSDELGAWPWLKTPEDVVDVLHQLGLQADGIASPSGSSYLEWPNGRQGLRGLHTFFSIDQGKEIPRVLDTIHKRAWLNGYGRILVGGNGVLHERSIVDRALATPNQPVFEHGAVLLDERIKQDRKVALCRYPNPADQYRQLKAANIAPLSTEEEAEYVRLVQRAKEEKQPEAERATETWVSNRTTLLPEGEREAARRALLDSRNNVHRDLSPDFPLVLNDNTVVFVRDIVAAPEGWHDKQIRDPFEPEYGERKATIRTKEQKDGRPKIISLAHGVAVVYYLVPRPQKASVQKPKNSHFKPAAFDDAGGLDVSSLKPFPSPRESECPCYIVTDEWTVEPGSDPEPDDGPFGPLPGTPPRPMPPGLWSFTYKRYKEGKSFLQTERISDPLHINAQAYDVSGNAFGRLVRFQTTAGTWREWAFPMALLNRDGAEVLAALLNMGFGIDSPLNRQKIVAYLMSSRPTKQVRCVPQIGWAGETFVLPDENIGKSASEIVLQSSEYAHGQAVMHGTSGTLEEWRTGVSAKAKGNPLLMLALSVAFAGPLLERTKSENGGIHLFGKTSSGKTTSLTAACSVWGGKDYVRVWRSTGNGLEGTAAMVNDCLLALDEISQADPENIGDVIYMLGNGVGKQRASKTGAARAVTRHRCAVISTGERSVADAMREGRRAAKAGQGVRLIDIDAGAGGIGFNEPHGCPTLGALTESITATATSHYGHAGRLFLRQLTEDTQDLEKRLTELRQRPEFRPDGAEGHVMRVAAKFALYGLAGELATEFGVTGWPPGAAIDAAIMAFQAWLAPRGKGVVEGRQALEAILSFIEKHGDSRFSDASSGSGLVRDRAGYWRGVEVNAGDGEVVVEREYLFHSAGLRDALSGLDFSVSVRELSEAGVLPPRDKDSTYTRVVRIAAENATKRLYPILPRKLAAALDGGRDGSTVTEFDPFADPGDAFHT